MWLHCENIVNLKKMNDEWLGTEAMNMLQAIYIYMAKCRLLISAQKSIHQLSGKMWEIQKLYRHQIAYIYKLYILEITPQNILFPSHTDCVLVRQFLHRIMTTFYINIDTF